MEDTKYNKGFSYKGLSIELNPKVYDPAEDTFLLLESIDVDINDSVFEIGTGCGIIALECARIGANVICSDINKIAVELTNRNYKKNKTKLKGNLEVRYGDLFSVLKRDEIFDIIIFNPPYLPTKKEDLIYGAEWLNIATNGGRNGLKKTKSFIQGLKTHLKINGRGYLIFSTLSERKKLEMFLTEAGFIYKIKKSQRFLDETIDVYELKKRL